VFTAGNSTARAPKVSTSSSSLAKACPRFTRLQFFFRNATSWLANKLNRFSEAAATDEKQTPAGAYNLTAV
jgi:hypothetical protein